MQISIPQKVNQIIKTIQAAGFEAYVVGGCVRDTILCREPEDWDITTSASTGQIKSMFTHTIDTGIRHGTVTVLLGGNGYEVTTYRIDGKYEDHRHPVEVTFTSSLQEDLQRRDFTINAMAYNDQDGLIDLFHGMEDVRQKIIRCVGRPEERFGEDALRMMRAVRFSAQLGYAIEENTKNAISSLASHLRRISAERIQTELIKLAVSSHPDYLRYAYETGITNHILPEFDRCMSTIQNNPHHCHTVGEHTLHSMNRVEPDKVLRLAMLFHDMGKPLTRMTDENGIDHFPAHAEAGKEICYQILRRLKFDNDTISRVTKLVGFHDSRPLPLPLDIRRAMAKIGKDFFCDFLKMQAADIKAQSHYKRREKTAWLEQITQIYTDILTSGQCVSLNELAVTGNDLILEGFLPGKEMGLILQYLLNDVIDTPEHNCKEYLLPLARHYCSRPVKVFEL